MIIIKKNIGYIFSIILITIWILYGIVATGPWHTNNIVETFYNILYGDGLFFYTQIAPLFVIAPAVMEYAMDIRSQNIKNRVTRIPYRNYLNIKYLSTYKYGFIFVYASFLILMGAMIIEKNIDVGKNFNLELGMNICSYTYLFIYFFLNFMYGVFYAKLSMLIASKNRSVVISIIFSFMIYFFIQLIGEMFIGNILCSKILNFHNAFLVASFSLWSQFQMYDLNILIFIIYSFILFIAMTIVLRIRYQKLEVILIECEK